VPAVPEGKLDRDKKALDSVTGGDGRFADRELDSDF
jgi:hypothetical protein